MTIKAVAFDKDGTLLDFQATWGGWACDLIGSISDGDTDLQARIAAKLQIDLDQRMVMPGSVVIAGTAADIGAQMAGIEGLGDQKTLTKMLIERSLDVTPVEITPLAALLDQLRALGLSLGIVTNDAQAAMLAQLQVLGIARHFDFVAGFDSGHGAKPDAGPCLAFARAVQTRPDQCAMVGDSLHDLQAARAAGMVAIGVASGLAPHAELAPFADVVLDDVTHLADWLKTHAS